MPTAPIGGELIVKKVTLILLALAVAIVGWLAWSKRAQVPPAVPVQGESGAEGVGLSAEAGASDDEREAAEADARTALADGRAAVTIRGRCVDSLTGRPVAGCLATIRGFSASVARLEDYILEHGEVAWRDPTPRTTGADGEFSFRFVPPPPHRFELDVGKEGSVSMYTEWNELLPGTVVDVGDVPIVPGCTVTGQVVDTAGVPQVGFTVRLLANLPPPDGQLTRRSIGGPISKEDGSFAFERPLAPGRWTMRDRGSRYQLARPVELDIAPSQATAFLQVILKREADIDYLSGGVMDEQGVPIPKVILWMLNRQGGTIGTNEDVQGEFRRYRSYDLEESVGPMELRPEHPGYEPFVGQAEYEWGTSGIQLVLQRGLTLDLQVTDADTGAPVEDFAVRCFPDLGGSRFPLDWVYEPREGGRHDGGRLSMLARRGPNMLSVEPEDSQYLPGELIRFEATEGTPLMQRIALHHPKSVTLLVRREDGAPVSTRVELLDPVEGASVDLETPALRIGEFLPPRNGAALLLQRGQTDAEGKLQLSASPERTLALRLLGPGHQPLVLEGLVFRDLPDPFVVEVTAGATITGTVEPLEILKSYDPDPDEVAKTRYSAADVATGLRLIQEGGPQVLPSAATVFPVNDVGSFEIRNVPPGDWELHVAYVFLRGFFARFDLTEFIQVVPGLRSGEIRRVHLDLSPLAKGRLSGQISLNGVPLAGAIVDASGIRSDVRGRSDFARVPRPVTAADGSFAVDLVPALYEVDVQFTPEGSERRVTLPLIAAMELTPGQEISQVFDLRSASVRLRVLGSDGETPVPGVQIHAWAPGTDWNRNGAMTGPDGWVTMEQVPAGTIELSVWPRSLATPEARRASGTFVSPTERIKIRPLEVGRHQREVTAELVMPKESGY